MLKNLVPLDLISDDGSIPVAGTNRRGKRNSAAEHWPQLEHLASDWNRSADCLSSRKQGDRARKATGDFKMSASEILKSLDSLDFTGDYLEELDLLAERLEEEDPEGEAIEPVLRFLEAHPGEDLGMPGPLVHYVERYFRRGYESKLLESLQRSPTPRTVWMLNRLLNGMKGIEKEPYLLEMKRLAKAEDSEVAALAGRFERLHQE